jgi:vacuolar-type H+-ATPase subunit H
MPMEDTMSNINLKEHSAKDRFQARQKKDAEAKQDALKYIKKVVTQLQEKYKELY